jgi:hypothetical protein
MKRRSMKLAAMLVATQWALAGDAFAALTAKANHDHIAIDFSYHGSTVTVRGESEAGVDLVVKITSPDGRQSMNRKGKVAGFLWMNVGSLTFEKAPNLYEVFSTRKLDEILSPEERATHAIGYDALEDHVEIDPAGSAEEKAKWFRQFVAFKESSKLYTEECKVHVEQTGIVKTLASMARDSASLYAILSIGIALSAGFGVGMVLRKPGGAH